MQSMLKEEDHHASEKELIKGCLLNDRRYQEQFYRLFFQTMMDHCRRFTMDESEQLEIVNRGFMKVFKYLHTFRFQGSLEGWIRRVIHHTALDFVKEKQQYESHLVPATQLHHLSIPDADPFMEEHPERYIRVAGFIPAISRKVFELFVFGNWPHADIAKELNISEGTSRWHLNQAKNKLKELFLVDAYAQAE